MHLAECCKKSNSECVGVARSSRIAAIGARRKELVEEVQGWRGSTLHEAETAAAEQRRGMSDARPPQAQKVVEAGELVEVQRKMSAPGKARGPTAVHKVIPNAILSPVRDGQSRRKRDA